MDFGVDSHGFPPGWDVYDQCVEGKQLCNYARDAASMHRNGRVCHWKKFPRKACCDCTWLKYRCIIHHYTVSGAFLFMLRSFSCCCVHIIGMPQSSIERVMGLPLLVYRLGPRCRQCNTDRGTPYLRMSLCHVPNLVRKCYVMCSFVFIIIIIIIIIITIIITISTSTSTSTSSNQVHNHDHNYHQLPLPWCFVTRNLQVLGDWPIFQDLRHRYGFLHRLDVPSSGLVASQPSTFVSHSANGRPLNFLGLLIFTRKS